MTSCPKCSCQSIQVCQGGTRCAACGHQERGVSRQQTHRTYVSFSPPGTGVGTKYRVMHDHEDLAELEAAWSRQVILDDAPPKVSIIMPTYKREHTIRYTIGSLLNQTFTAWELIIIDNEPGHSYQFTDKRIRYYNHSEERGAGYARNMGIQYISSPLVGFFDDDDIMLPNYLELLVKPFLDNPKTNMTICRIQLVEGFITDHNNFCTPASIVKREFVTPCWIQATNHDQKFFGDIFASISGKNVVCIPNVLVHAYTSGQGGIRAGAL